ncbi:MAG: hypothetical protein RR364_08780 [Lachnospiraceae bacterium]
MDYQPNEINVEVKDSNLETAAIILGIIGVILSCFYLIGLPCSALSILLALLARGRDVKVLGRNRIGLVLGIVGLILTIIIFIALVYTFFNVLSSTPSGVENFIDEIYRMMDQPKPL